MQIFFDPDLLLFKDVWCGTLWRERNPTMELNGIADVTVGEEIREERPALSSRLIVRTWTRDEIYDRVTQILVDATGVDEEDVLPQARLNEELGAESIDELDITFRLEKAFGLKLPRGEFLGGKVFGVSQDSPYVITDGEWRFTSAGLKRIQELMPWLDMGKLEKIPELNRMYTVDNLVNYIVWKLRQPRVQEE